MVSVVFESRLIVRRFRDSLTGRVIFSASFGFVVYSFANFNFKQC